MNAALRGDEEIVKLLVDWGARVNARNKVDYNALHAAATAGDNEVIGFLLDKGAEPNVLDLGYSPLMWASGRGAIAGMRRLLAAGAEARCREPALGTTALVWAAANGKSEVVDLLLRQGADVRATDSEGATAVS